MTERYKILLGTAGVFSLLTLIMAIIQSIYSNWQYIVSGLQWTFSNSNIQPFIQNFEQYEPYRIALITILTLMILGINSYPEPSDYKTHPEKYTDLSLSLFFYAIFFFVCLLVILS